MHPLHNSCIFRSASQPPAKSNHSSFNQPKRPMLRLEGRRNKSVERAKTRQAEEPAVPRDKETFWPIVEGRIPCKNGCWTLVAHIWS